MVLKKSLGFSWCIYHNWCLYLQVDEYDSQEEFEEEEDDRGGKSFKMEVMEF